MGKNTEYDRKMKFDLDHLTKEGKVGKADTENNRERKSRIDIIKKEKNGGPHLCKRVGCVEHSTNGNLSL